MFVLVLLLAAAGIAFVVYHKYVLAAANEPPLTDSVCNTPKRANDVQCRKPVAPAKTPMEPVKTGSQTPAAVKTPKPRTPRPIQVITLGIGGDDMPVSLPSTI